MTKIEILENYKMHILACLKKVSGLIMQYAVWQLIIIVALGILFFINNKIQLKKISTTKMVCIFLTVSYIGFLFYITIGSRQFGSVRVIDIVPFDKGGGTFYIVFYSLLNGLAFLPLGLLLPMTIKKMREIKRIVLTGFGLSLFIEVTQYVLACGDSQTEDIIMNTLGCYVGYKLWDVFDKKRTHKQHSNV